MNGPSTLCIGKDGFIYADGVKIGRAVPERGSIQFVDRDRRRCQEKGREVVEIKIVELTHLVLQK